MTQTSFTHQPVLLSHVLAGLPPQPGRGLDCTLGGAGHAQAMLEAVPGLHLIGVDRDAQALTAARARLAPWASQTEFRHQAYAEAAQDLVSQGVKLDWILADLGVSSPQLDQAMRGFSFMKPGPLDMRMDPSQGLSAQELLQQITQQELFYLLRDLGEEPFAPKLSRVIKAQADQLTTTLDLARLVEESIPRKAWPKKIHPATKTFQAIRMAVNDELGQLERLLDQVPQLLNPNGRVMIIAFHSLEDRIVKQRFRQWEDPCTCSKEIPYCQCGLKPQAKLLQKKPFVATEEELEHNPRSRSARLRIASWL